MSSSHSPASDSKHVSEAARDVALEPIARECSETLNALFELYAHDFSEHVPLELKESGRFELSVGEHWWSRDDHYPFFIRAGGQLAGFALVRRGSTLSKDPRVMDVAEFFVVRGQRRKHVGRQAAAALLKRFPGKWEVRVRQANLPALSFWLRTLREPVRGEVDRTTYSASGVAWHVLRVEACVEALRDAGDEARSAEAVFEKEGAFRERQ
ncbi:MAG: hypothetical protein RL385_4399 [Pseudomonadota bacterium]|jgi:predicted acetyltransferase